MKKLFVFLGDIVSSRKINNEAGFQRHLEEICALLNRTHRSEIHADFKIVKGIDEIGAVLRCPSRLYEIIDTLLKELHPYRMRMVLVYDCIDVGVETGDVSRMDGRAFHRASLMMEELKKSRLLFRLSFGNDLLDAMIESQVNLILLLKSHWSETERRVIREYEKTGNQYKVAEVLGISQQAVSKNITKSYWKEIRLIEEKLNEVIESYVRGLCGGA